jgi:Coiled-coil domain-containing protein 124 /Oxs1
MKFGEYHTRELPALKEAKPGLKAPQYKDIIFKKWQRAPENPANQK